VAIVMPVRFYDFFLPKLGRVFSVYFSFFCVCAVKTNMYYMP